MPSPLSFLKIIMDENLKHKFETAKVGITHAIDNCDLTALRIGLEQINMATQHGKKEAILWLQQEVNTLKTESLALIIKSVRARNFFDFKHGLQKLKMVLLMESNLNGEGCKIFDILLREMELHNFRTPNMTVEDLVSLSINERQFVAYCAAHSENNLMQHYSAFLPSGGFGAAFV